MFRHIATIGFLCLSAGSIAAEKAPSQNTIDDPKIEKALADLLDERAAWGPGPSQAAASATSAENRQALKDYLAQRESWGTGPQDIATSADQNAPMTLGAYLARRNAWGTTPAITSADNGGALKDYLAWRESWGTGPQDIAASAYQTPLTLGAYLARRVAWGRAPAITSADASSALKDYLARRESWGTGPQDMAASAYQTPLTLGAYLARRVAWGKAPGVTSADNGGALKDYLARRESWGTGPQDIATSADQNAPKLARILSERATWGSSPAISSAEANASQPVAALEHVINRRTQERSSSEMRLAALSNATLSDAVTCTEALQQIAHSSRIHFAAGSAVITSKDSGELEKLAEAGRDCAGLRLRIEGHTDSLGDAAKNQALSQKRAKAVADYLNKAGFSAAALEAVGFGETRPLVPNTTPANRARNRRIEFVPLTN